MVRYSVELNVRAGNIPDSIEADVGSMELGDALKISDINLPDGATPTIDDRDFTIATIAAPSALRSEADAEEEGEEGEAEATEADAEGEEESAE